MHPGYTEKPATVPVFCACDLSLPTRLHPEENIELWDTWMKRCDLKRRSLAMNTPQTTNISHLIITHF